MSLINFITGGAGFIGSQLTNRLLSENQIVISIDNLYTGNEENIKLFKKNKNFKFIKYDIEQYFDTKVDRIWHLASIASPTNYLKNPIKTINTCFLGTRNVLELALKNKCKVLLASTSEIYGDSLVNPQRESYLGNVNCFGSRACYSEGKRISEALFYEYKRIYNLDIRVARIFNTYGPGSSLSDDRVIPSFIRGIKLDSKVFINGDGEQTRSFCYISDLINGLLKLMDSNYSYPLNLGNNEEVSINELAKLIISKYEKKVSMVYLEKKNGEPKSRRPAIDLALNKLGWQPTVNLYNGIDKTINYFNS